ncbi:glyoxalase family protein [Natronoarchaeum philippinense]|uniref:Glyoxalase family protein n=1 Tax=Natronoarchaeum philippinense TaxID=558529 RepID=A0A285P398_NATPI|nr:ring-cleaving dioxygenase [Natronoarchaeum philippinense]SNZ16224.1 glyoxalase family protein [Natronoarchaeum philippinense]
MAPTTAGLHHVTAMAGDPQRNADFYVGTLGLRFVKRTVNHDDTGTYHFYFGDEVGTPGTNITFFPWPESGRSGQFGAGQTRDTAYAIRPDSLEYWTDRLDDRGVEFERTERFDETVLRFEDPDGIGLELVATDLADDAEVQPWADGPVPVEHQLRGFHGVTLGVAEFGPTESVLTDVLGYELDRQADGRRRYRAADGGPHSIVDLVETDAGRGQMGVGTVHHVAFMAEDEAEQEQYREAFAERGLRATTIVDRTYFRSIYCREPGGVLFEIATTGPGFTVDEDIDELGSSLVLPERLEAKREAIEAQLPAFDGPSIDHSSADAGSE